MEDRCAVETWAEFGPSGSSPCTARIKSGFETDFFLCTGSDEVYVFNSAERKLTVSYLMPAALMYTDPQVMKIHSLSCWFVADCPPASWSCERPGCQS